ncbi:hypothetical protein I6F33_36865 [Bradyrhizobium sp. BRP20]|uniref:hypothetical protein n=1 Tax=Bradyrhizobium sp. IC3123 TaxID=2793803 RepID=UPI001CD6F988|nr:hypothetical protein [Bradyrhizobium sp. IC3123]MCA1438459.1 hypothetical protein [Bradyrhizobium sp. BRP20]MCA1473307.1 hypothetical protein [Bradyrhizobium sp. IC3195]MCA1502139.1 hypothetical protein [Bradyrhizobium sp. NBAIM14]MCA1552445.1 hypothetical protein [Bradyrhizobium sp. BRP19]MCA1394577.1 hypothetical protein [Bradyrhizobium sp. IC3123]
MQPKAITFPTDAKLLHAAIKGLNRLARKHGIKELWRNLGDDGVRKGGVSRRVTSLPEPLEESDTP